VRRNDQERRVGERALILYKAAHGGVVFLVGVAVAIALTNGGDTWLRTLAITLRENATRAFTVHLAEWLLRASEPRRLEIGSAALIGDGLFSAFEGWSLYRRYRFAPWLVVIATTAFVPFEIVEIVRHFRASRIALLVLNVAIVAYLLRRLATERRKSPSDVAAKQP
jgi:uncharacterized membrane protein (DUF2068 family)